MDREKGHRRKTSVFIVSLWSLRLVNLGTKPIAQVPA